MTYEPPAGILIGPESMKSVNKGEHIQEFLPDTFAEIGDLGKGRSGPGIAPLGIVRAVINRQVGERLTARGGSPAWSGEADSESAHTWRILAPVSLSN
jgi:hypothetical protein